MRPHPALRQKRPELEDGRRYVRRSPTMAMGLSDHVWSWTEFLSHSVLSTLTLIGVATRDMTARTKGTAKRVWGPRSTRPRRSRCRRTSGPGRTDRRVLRVAPSQLDAELLPMGAVDERGAQPPLGSERTRVSFLSYVWDRQAQTRRRRRPAPRGDGRQRGSRSHAEGRQVAPVLPWAILTAREVGTRHFYGLSAQISGSSSPFPPYSKGSQQDRKAGAYDNSGGE
jgi:hypothetical protein